MPSCRDPEITLQPYQRRKLRTIWVGLQAQTMNFLHYSWFLSHSSRLLQLESWLPLLSYILFITCQNVKRGQNPQFFKGKRPVWKCDWVKLKTNNHLKLRWKLNNRLCSLWLSLTLSSQWPPTRSFTDSRHESHPNPHETSCSAPDVTFRLKSDRTDYDILWIFTSRYFWMQQYRVLPPIHLLNVYQVNQTQD